MRRLAYLPAAVLSFALAGCGPPSQPLPMAVGPAEALQIRGWVPDALRAQIAVASVQGGAETGRWWGSKVNATALKPVGVYFETCGVIGTDS